MVTDFHSHVLPGIDDGSRTVADSIKMLQMLAAQGVSRVIATPHFYPEKNTPKTFIAKRNFSEQLLREEMVKYNDMPELIVGAEVYYYQGISDWESLRDLTIGDYPCILIEMPFRPWTVPMYQELADIYERHNLWPVVAHLDRYLGPMQLSGVSERLFDMPVYVQANASAFIRLSTRRKMLRLLQNGQINLLGSDCHDLKGRKPNIQSAVKIIRRHLGEDAITRIQNCENFLLSDPQQEWNFVKWS